MKGMCIHRQRLFFFFFKMDTNTNLMILKYDEILWPFNGHSTVTVDFKTIQTIAFLHDKLPDRLIQLSDDQQWPLQVFLTTFSFKIRSYFNFLQQPYNYINVHRIIEPITSMLVRELFRKFQENIFNIPVTLHSRGSYIRYNFHI